MLAGMDDREDPEDLITMEAMSGLSRIFSQIDEGHVRPILINIALRIRPCFEKVGGAALAAHLHNTCILVVCGPCNVSYSVFWPVINTCTSPFAIVIVVLAFSGSLTGRCECVERCVGHSLPCTVQYIDFHHWH